MDVRNKHIVIMGLGKSGAAAARFLCRQQARVTVTDRADEKALAPYPDQLRELEIRFALGGHPAEVFDGADLIVLSPGVPHTLDCLNRCRERGVPVIGEVELAARFIRQPIVAVTGTNGKTTTTTLVGEMLEASGKTVFVGGNIGSPLIGYVAAEQPADIVVAEISSFQLDTVETFRPSVAALLNIAEDHLDRYPDFEGYVRSKARIFENQKAGDRAVVNGADPVIRSMVKGIESRPLFFNTCDENEYGAIVRDESLIVRLSDRDSYCLDLSCARHLGRHNLENVAAASLAALAAGADPEGIEIALKRFRGLPHRLEFVADVDGVRYMDDSKATNTAAVIKALASMTRPVVLIMGGRGKETDFSKLEGMIGSRVKHLILMGETRTEIRRALGHTVPTENADSMADAVQKARRQTVSGDVVLLSPACASFDMFDSYAHRGRMFRRAVEELTCKSA